MPIQGAITAWEESFETVHGICAFAFIIFVLIWCHCDADERAVKIGAVLRATIFLLAIIGLPIYLVRSRGAWRGLRASLLAVLFFGASFIAAVITTVVLYGEPPP